jgi:tetratricopeptide (TPR) repeat protein
MSSSDAGAAAMPTTVVDFPTLGITLKGIHVFLAASGGREAFVGKTTSAVCAEMVLPATSASRLSYCAQRADHADEVGTATVFVSHAWGYEFLAVLDALDAWEGKQSAGELAAAAGGATSRPSTVFWFDIFCNPQHGTAEKPFEWWAGCFRDNIQRIGHTLLVLDWEDRKPLSRVWCVWELACTVGKTLEVIMGPKEVEKFERDLLSQFHTLVKKICAVDVATAKALHVSDRERILAAVAETYGVSKVNQMVAGELRAWMAFAGKAALSRLPVEQRGTSSLISYAAILLRKQGKLVEAESLFREKWESAVRVLDKDHPERINSIANLGLHLQLQGRLAEAEPLLMESLEEKKRVHGPDSVGVFWSLNNLALLRQVQGKLGEAELLLGESLEGYKRVLGPDSISTLKVLSDFAVLLNDLGKLAEAEQLSRDSLEGLRRAMGSDHPLTLTSLHNLAVVLINQGKLSEAEPFLRESLEDRKRVLGFDHFDTLANLVSLADLRRKQREMKEALTFAEGAYGGLFKQLGSGHFRLSDPCHALGVILRLLGRHEEALPHTRQAYEERRSRLGDAHRDTRKSRLSLARLEGDVEVERELVEAGVVE